MTLFEQIQSDMYAAMKGGDKSKANTLRTTLAKLKDKKIEKRDDLTEQEEIKVIQTLVKQRKVEILNGYLPQMMSADDIKAIVQSVADEVGATSMADMGKVMPEVMKRGKGLIDGKSAQQFVREILG